MIEVLAVEHVAENVELAHSVHWPDAASDWRVLYAAATVLGIRQEGRLVAHGALGDYGVAATLAKMVVAPDLQRRGLGARLLDRLLAMADERGIAVGLCATEQGQPLYASRGFAVTGELSVLVGTPRAGTSDGGNDVTALDAPAACDLDQRLSGCDRARMLVARQREANAACWSKAGGACGFGMASAQGELSLVGPIVAETEANARSVASALFARVAGPVRIDVPAERTDFRAWLSDLGLVERAVRVEMARGGARMPWQIPGRFALATQAWG